MRSEISTPAADLRMAFPPSRRCIPQTPEKKKVLGKRTRGPWTNVVVSLCAVLSREENERLLRVIAGDQSPNERKKEREEGGNVWRGGISGYVCVREKRLRLHQTLSRKRNHGLGGEK